MSVFASSHLGAVNVHGFTTNVYYSSAVEVRSCAYDPCKLLHKCLTGYRSNGDCDISKTGDLICRLYAEAYFYGARHEKIFFENEGGVVNTFV